MQINPFLSISIPTFNRARYLDYCLEILIPLVKDHNIQIYISDNASNDDTEFVVKKRATEYPLIIYKRNSENIGMDGNFEQALKLPNAKYVWMLGDSYRIPKEGIDYFLRCVSTNSINYDAFVFNFRDRVSGIPSKDYVEKNDLLENLGWHITCISCLIINSTLIQNANFSRFKNSYLVHVGILFDYIDNKCFTVNWNDSISIQTIEFEGFNKLSWQDKTFEIWTERWSNLIFSLSNSYRLSAKINCIKSHGVNSGLFSLKNMLILRSNNVLNISIYNKFSKYFGFTINHSRTVILLISVFPIKVLTLMKLIYKKFSSMGNTPALRR